jgi:hypothetical protein
MTTPTVTAADLSHLMSLLLELTRAGRAEEAAAVARAYAVMNDILCTQLYPHNDDDPQLARMVEAAEEDARTGRLIPHEVVLERFRSLDNG